MFLNRSEYIIRTQVLTKFPENWTLNFTSRVLTRRTTDKRRSQNLTMGTMCPGELKTNDLTKFHKDWTQNVTSRNVTYRVLTRKTDKRKNAPPTTRTIFEHVQDIIGKNLLTKFHDDRTINMAFRVFTRKHATPPWRPYIIGLNSLTKFHDDRTINVASRVLTRKNAPSPGGHFHEDWNINVACRVLIRFYYSHIGIIF
ncbi:hypothetical protein DPMN_063309 [Dreissena polymorpha]|uniref:Uncharacterized protein n=1 Tax=Dreissena polymorpha TaxID=45954 RepID=A0A9D4HIH4_DREPO|nr:hypothetical protein DPMN_063309 [Dreissena polymorpha]